MNINDVAAEIGGTVRVADIGLRVYEWDADAVSVPALVLALPMDYQYDLTYGRGSDEFTLPLIVLVGKTDAKNARRRLGLYLSGSGPSSLKSIVDSSNTNTYVTCDTVRIQRADDIGAYTVGAITYLGATFHARITGPGS